MITTLPNSYWVIPGYLLVGPYPGSFDREQASENLNFLARLGIRTLVNLCTEGERTTGGVVLVPYCMQLPEFMTEKRFPMADRATPAKYEVSKILDHVDESIVNKVPTYLHCRGGKFRTGTIVSCFLIRHGLASCAAAIEMNARLREFYDATPCELSPTQTNLILGWRKGE